VLLCGGATAAALPSSEMGPPETGAQVKLQLVLQNKGREKPRSEIILRTLAEVGIMVALNKS